MYYNSIPIINYHKVADEKEFGITTIPVEKFHSQIDMLHNHGYHTVTYDQLDKHDDHLPEKPIIITFDDGYQSVYQNALPILQKYGYKAVVFIVTDFIGELNAWEAFKIQRRYRHLSRAMIKEMHDLGFEIGSHSKSHPYLPYLNDIHAAEEIRYSKIILEDLLGTAVLSFCFPYGRFSQKNFNHCVEYGYRYMTGNRQRKNHQSNYFSRRNIYSTDTLHTVRNKIVSFNRINPSYYGERLIQLGAYTGIIKKLISTNS